MVETAWLAATWGLEPQIYAGEHGSDAALTGANYRKAKARPSFLKKRSKKLLLRCRGPLTSIRKPW
jgi:hypothetical protein